MKNNNCFYCLNGGKGILAEDGGSYHPCLKGISNEGLQDVKSCPSHEENKGFQIGGYYTHMHFIPYGAPEPGVCLTWTIHGDGDFPTDDPSKFISFHICDFKQIEEWVKVWGIELRKRGWIEEALKDDQPSS